MDKVMVVLMAALLCCSFGRSSPLQGLVERDSQHSAAQQQRRVGKLHEEHGVQEVGGLTYVQGYESGEGHERGGPRRRRLAAATTTAAINSATKQQPGPSRKTERRSESQEQEAVGKTTRTEEVPSAAAAAAAATSVAAAAAGGDGSRANAADGTPGLPGDIVARAARVDTVDALEGQSQQTLEGGGTVEAVEGMNAEDDKGIKEGEVEGFVVVAGDDKSGEGNPGDSLDNDNGSTSGISNNIMVIVFCALAFVANGGFLVYVFWVM